MSSEAPTEVKKKRLLKPEIGAVESKKSRVEKSMAVSEEEEALLRDPKSDLSSFQASCDFLKSSIKSIKQLKESKPEKSTAAEIASIRRDATIHFIHMKKLNRLSHFRCRKVRDKTNEAKLNIDQCHLQLQNLLYEAMHLEKEITKCMEFKSKDEEIELIPVEDFYKTAPDTVSNPEKTKSDEHLQMLARLEWELEQRKQLSGQLTKTRENKEKISQEIQKKQDYLETLQPKLAEVLQATRPVQDYLDMPYDRIKEEHEKAQHLPMPLYILYMQASAYQEACDKCLNVSIQGDVDAAKSLSTFTFELDDDSDSDQEDQDKPDSKRRRKNQEARKLEKKNRVLRKHPLNVVLDITSKGEGSQGSLQITFYFCVALNIVTVSVKVTEDSKLRSTCVSGGDLLSPDLILDDIYPGDHGNESPNVANLYELKRHGLQEISTYIPLIGRPFMWSQWMGGLQFLKKEMVKVETDTPNVGSGPCVATVRAKHAVSAANMQETITLLRERIRSRLCLMKQLSSLERGIIPISSQALKMYPAKINAHLSSWKRSTFEDLNQLPHARRVIDAGLVKESDLVFVAVVDRSSGKLTAHVVLTANCPQVPPLFILEITYQTRRTALNDVHVKEMEEEVNLHYPELLLSSSVSQGSSSSKGGERDELLACQVQRLLMCLDVYLETDPPASLTVPVEIPQEKMMPRTARGPSRSKPFKYVPELGIFTHRC